MSYFVYIIQSLKDNSLYVGQTNSLQERINRHNQGHSRYTKPKRPWKLLYSEEFESRSQAVKREIALKSLHRKDMLLNLIGSAGQNAFR
ncbi:MAG: GIY-YIG nuclease family protein [Nitrospiraceae bacterium]|nr:GIY-YIG nuclease family protein [Nitrospiraceae bacterium]